LHGVELELGIAALRACLFHLRCRQKVATKGDSYGCVGGLLREGHRGLVVFGGPARIGPGLGAVFDDEVGESRLFEGEAVFAGSADYWIAVRELQSVVAPACVPLS